MHPRSGVLTRRHIISSNTHTNRPSDIPIHTCIGATPSRVRLSHPPCSTNHGHDRTRKDAITIPTRIPHPRSAHVHQNIWRRRFPLSLIHTCCCTTSTNTYTNRPPHIHTHICFGTLPHRVLPSHPPHSPNHDHYRHSEDAITIPTRISHPRSTHRKKHKNDRTNHSSHRPRIFTSSLTHVPTLPP